jgi:large subunit ribosomal protein L25
VAWLAAARHRRLSAKLRQDQSAFQRSSTVPEVRIAAEPRSEFGKGPSRRVRRAGRVPAVLYGHGTEPRHLSLPGHDVLLALRTANVLIRLEGMPGGSQLALPKAIQRDAIRGTVEHVDLIMVRRGEKVTVDVPVTVTGEVTSDGLLDQQLVQISVEAEATNIPPGIEVNVEGMPIGAAVHAGDLTLPAGVSLAVEADVLVLHVIAAPTAAQIEAELGAEAAEGEAAPAAASAPAPAPAEGGGEPQAAADQSS